MLLWASHRKQSRGNSVAVSDAATEAIRREVRAKIDKLCPFHQDAKFVCILSSAAMTVVSVQPIRKMTPIPASTAARRWSLPALEALFELPFMDLIARAQEVHRQHHAANTVDRKSTRLNSSHRL